MKDLLRDSPLEIPEIPGRWIWTSSSLKLFRLCKRKFFWKYIARISPAYRDVNLMVGSAFHEAMEHLYTSPKEWSSDIPVGIRDELEQERVENADFYDADEFAKLETGMEAFVGMANGYADHYMDEALALEGHSVEQEFLLDMGDFDLSGSIDLLMDDGIMEHKTVSKLSEPYIRRLPMDTQIRCYLYGAQNYFDVDARRVTYNVVRKAGLKQKRGENTRDFHLRIQDDYVARPEHYFHREVLLFNDGDLEAFEHETQQTHEEFCRLAYESDDPRDPRTWGISDQQCNAYFRMCEFFNCCTVGLDEATAVVFDQRDSVHQELNTI